jgi:hypothetical protein
MKRRTTVGFSLLAAVALVAGLGVALRSEAAPEVRVYRSATCGCCVAWARHLAENGFRVQVVDVDDLAQRKAALGVPRELASCHTAEVEGFLVEGHVPASDVQRLLRERPDVRGLAVPGMPEGSPGMEGPEPEAYTVFAFRRDGGSQPFAEHTPPYRN